MSGQFNDPIRVVAFNTLEHWSDDVSEEIATEIQTRCDMEGAPSPSTSETSSPVTPVRTGNLHCGSLESWLTMKTRSPTLPTRKQRATGSIGPRCKRNWSALNGLQVSESRQSAAARCALPSIAFQRHSGTTCQEYAMNSILVHGHSCGTPIIWNVKLHSMLSLHE